MGQLKFNYSCTYNLNEVYTYEKNHFVHYNFITFTNYNGQYPAKLFFRKRRTQSLNFLPFHAVCGKERA